MKYVFYLPNTHSFFNIGGSNWIGKINYKLGKLFHINYVFRIIWISIYNFCTPCHLVKEIVNFSDYEFSLQREVKIWSTCNGCSFWRVCLSAVKSQKAGGANPVSDSLIPVNSLIRFMMLCISSSTALTLIVHCPWPYKYQNKVIYH